NSSRRWYTRFSRDWSSDVCSSDLDGIRNRAFAKTFETDIHAYLEKDIDNTGVLTNRTLAFSTHARIGQNLRNRILGCRTLLQLRSEERRGGNWSRSQ